MRRGRNTHERAEKEDLDQGVHPEIHTPSDKEDSVAGQTVAQNEGQSEGTCVGQTARESEGQIEEENGEDSFIELTMNIEVKTIDTCLKL